MTVTMLYRFGTVGNKPVGMLLPRPPAGAAGSLLHIHVRGQIVAFSGERNPAVGQTLPIMVIPAIDVGDLPLHLGQIRRSSMRFSHRVVSPGSRSTPK